MNGICRKNVKSYEYNMTALISQKLSHIPTFPLIPVFLFFDKCFFAHFRSSISLCNNFDLDCFYSF